MIINGSPRLNGNSSGLINEMINTFNKEGVEVDNYQNCLKAIRGCMACNYCYEHKECVFKDDVNDLAKRFEHADGLVIISPVYSRKRYFAVELLHFCLNSTENKNLHFCKFLFISTFLSLSFLSIMLSFIFLFTGAAIFILL